MRKSFTLFNFYKALIISGLFIFLSAASNAQVTGKVFRDFNADGMHTTAAPDPIEPGLKDVTVNAYDAGGGPYTAITAADGKYTISSGTGPYRVEFILPSYYYASKGSLSNTTVQFAAAGGTANLGVNCPADYCQANPNIITSCYLFGNQITGANKNGSAVISFPNNAGDMTLNAADAAYDVPTAHTTNLQANQVGTTWGLAYAKTTQNLYAASFFKKHTGFGKGADGTINTADDAGAIYVINPTTNLVIATFTVPNATTNHHNTANYLVDNGNTAWDAVGKTSLGGMDLSDDEDSLFVMNLENRTLYALNPTTGAVLNSVAMPTTLPGCGAAGDARPFAVEYYKNRLYVGIICSGESDQAGTSVNAYVYEVNPTTMTVGTSPVFQMDMDYLRGKANSDVGHFAAWKPWRTTFGTIATDHTVVYPQPILTSLAFDKDNLILGFRDRVGDQVGQYTPSNPALPAAGDYEPRSAGDILRACGGINSWTLESNGRCGGTGSAIQNSGQGPGNAEFYYGDAYSYSSNGTPGVGNTHDELALGGVLQIQGLSSVMTTVYDPIPNSSAIFDSGVRWQSNTTGNFTQAYRVYDDVVAVGDFGKANGLGDLVALCNAQPIEIGNRVFMDTNSDGIQDPNEMGVDGVVVKLYKAGIAVDSIPTANGGQWFFANLDANTAYDVKILSANIPSGKQLTTKDVTTNGKDLIDSDASLVGSDAVIAYTTGNAGENNHTLDFGFKVACTQPTAITFTKTPPTCTGATANNDGKITFTSATNTDKYFINSGATSTGTYATASAIPTTGTDLQTTIPNAGETYTIRFYNGNDACFKDTTVNVAAVTCIVPCTPPTAGTNTPAEGTCTGTTANNDAKIDFTGITNADKAGIFEGATYTGTDYATTTGTVTAGATSFTGLKHNTQYTVRIFNAANDCFVDVTITTPAKNCTATPPLTPCVAGNTGGQVWRDFAEDGTKAVADTFGLAGVTVKAYDCAGVEIGSTVTDAKGQYTFSSITPSAVAPIRIEFSNLPAPYLSSFAGSGNGTNTQFVNAPGCNVHFGVNDPNDYCQNNPRMVVPQYQNGLSAGNTTGGMMSGYYDYSGKQTQYGGTGPDAIKDFETQQIGTTWGLAYQKENKRMFASTFLHRHSDIKDGTGYFYVLDYSSAIPSIVQSVNLQGVTPANGGAAIDLGTICRGGGCQNDPGNTGIAADYTLPASPATPNVDLDAFGKVSKVSFGDIDIDDNKKLWLVNLKQRALIEVDISGATVATSSAKQYPIDAIAGVPTCTNGIFRPYGLKFHKGRGYLGGVCTGELSGDSTNLSATVISFDPANIAAGFTTELTFSLETFRNLTNERIYGWRPWFDNWANAYTWNRNPQALLSDIEFDANDNMILGFKDRLGDQMGVQNYLPLSGNTTISTVSSFGDLVFACKKDGVYYQEGTPQCPYKATPTDYFNDTRGDAANDGGLGGLAFSFVKNQIVNTVVDPKPANVGTGFVNSQGWETFDVATGNQIDWYEVVKTGSNKPFFAKNNGIGDIEMLCSEAPLQIGNYVWNDTDKDGVQDPCETPLSTVKVTLYKDVAGTLTKIAETTTSANGEYYFSDKNAAGITWIGTAADTTLLPTQAYKIVFGETQYAAGKLTISGANYELTAKDATTNFGNDQNDSDAAEMSIAGTNYPSIALTTGTAGTVNHTYDVGFKIACTPPTVGTNTPAEGTCNGATANNDAKIDFTGITNADKAGIVEGATYTGTDYATTTGVVTAGAVSFIGLKHNTQYTVRIFNAANACFTDVTITTPTKTCSATQSCNCKEYIYLNEPDINAILKFEVGSPVLLTEKLGANGGIIPQQHWYPGTDSSLIAKPHGVTSDLNGNIYSGSNENGSSSIKKLNCDGEIDTTFNLASAGDIFNMFTIDNTLYKNSIAGPQAYDLCTGGLIGVACLSHPDGSPFSADAANPFTVWGQSYNSATERVYVNTYFGAFRYLWVLTKNELLKGINSTMETCTPPLLSRGTSTQTFNNIALGDKWLPNDIQRIQGVTSDNSGNMYMVTWRSGGTPSQNVIILKYNALGEYQSQSLLQSSMKNTHGIVWSETNRLYLANRTDSVTVDCISVLDATNLTYLGAGAPNPNLPASNSAKAISILKECCPVNLPATFQRSVCGEAGAKFYLNKEAFDTCDGIVCGSSWTPVGTLTGMTFDPCDNSVTVTGAGCGTFTLNIGAVSSTSCGAQSSTFTICNFLLPSAITFTQSAPTCTGATANNDGKITFTSAANADKYFINSGATSTGTYATATAIPAGGTDIQTLIPNTGGSYTIRFYNAVDDCFKDTTVTVAAVTCSATCTQPTAGTNTPAKGTCTGVTANDDAKIDFTGIANADKAGIVEGATYTGTDYATTTGVVTAGATSFTGLKHSTQYTVRIFNATNDCFVDVTITTPTKTCAIPCPSPNCGTLSIQKL